MSFEQFRPTEGRSSRSLKIIKRPPSEPLAEPIPLVINGKDPLMLEVEQECGEPLRDVLTRLYDDESLSYMEIGQKFSVSPDTVLLWMNKLEIPRQSRLAEPVSTHVEEILPPALSQEAIIFIGGGGSGITGHKETSLPRPKREAKVSIIRPFRSERTPPPRPTYKPLP